MGISLLIGIIFLILAGCSRKTPIAFVFWFPVAATTTIIALLAINGIPIVQEGPGGLTALGWIPVLIIWACCAVIGVACWFTRPKWKWGSHSAIATILITVGAYSAVATIVLNDSRLWGYYDLKIKILDWKQQPIPGVWVHSLRQNSDLDLYLTLFPDNVETSVRSDAEGEVDLQANFHQRMGILVNSTYGNLGRNRKYRFLDCELESATNGASPLEIMWSRLGNEEGSNMNHYSTKLSVPTQAALTVYLPEVGGDDSSPYPITTDSQTH
ncbi:MAG: hypothetical protein LV481_15330 [Methylacidiphilales bacterium]|nr:hypothetical protein [Candidatus Methylacidiphilales bacterium]